MKIEEAMASIREGEGPRIEFKAKIELIAHDVCAFLNTEGGTILCGISDDGGIVGVQAAKATQRVSEILQKITPVPTVAISKIKIDEFTVVVLRVDSSERLPSVGNIAYVRAGANNMPLSIPDVLERASESLLLFFDEQPSKAGISELDRRAVQSFLKKRAEVRGINARGSLEENLRRLRISVMHRGREQLSWAGLLMFGKEPSRFLPQARVSLVRFTDVQAQTYSDSREFSGSIPNVIDAVERYLAENLREVGGIPAGFRRERFFEYPLEALREALVNAIAHRNYVDPSDVKIFLFPGRLHIKNPGAFLPGVSPERPQHKPRNPLLMSFLYDLGYVERYGFGITRILESCEAHPIASVDIKTSAYRTELVFSQHSAGVELDPTDRKILVFLGGNAAGAKDLTRHLGISRQALNQRIRRLMGIGLVIREGAGRSTRYRSIKSEK